MLAWNLSLEMESSHHGGKRNDTIFHILLLFVTSSLACEPKWIMGERDGLHMTTLQTGIQFRI